jgi:hypothetical protein
MKTDPVTRDDIPAYEVRVETSEDGKLSKMINAELLEHRSYDGMKISTKIKYDYMIGGWDYDPANSKNPKLFLGMDITLLHSFDGKLREWIDPLSLQNRLNYNEKMTYMDKEGFNKELYVERMESDEDNRLVENKETADEDPLNEEETRALEEDDPNDRFDLKDGEYPLREYDDPELVSSNQMKFSDSIYKYGSFNWVETVNADGKDVRILFQINGIVWKKLLIDGSIFFGTVINGGFNLPGANRIYHDPIFASDFYELEIKLKTEEEVTTNNERIIFTVSLIFIIILISLLSFYGSIITSSEKKMKPPNFPNGTYPNTVMERDKYDKKKTEDEEYYESYYVDWDD